MRRKYGNRKAVIQGITFDSVKEAERYLVLQDMAKYGEIEDLELQVSFVLLDSYKNGNGKKIREMTYKADFVYTDTETGETIVEDVKSPGTRTQVYLLKKKLFEKKYHPLTITEVM